MQLTVTALEIVDLPKFDDGAAFLLPLLRPAVPVYDFIVLLVPRVPLCLLVMLLPFHFWLCFVMPVLDEPIIASERYISPIPRVFYERNIFNVSCIIHIV